MIDMCLDDFPAIVLAMTAAADCVALHEDYMGVVHSLCGMALYVASTSTACASDVFNNRSPVADRAVLSCCWPAS